MARHKHLIASLGFSVLGAAFTAAAGPAPLEQAIAAYKSGDMTEARTLAEPLATSGDAKAAALTGYLYEQGLGGKKDEARATAFYRTAAGKNDLDSLVALGRMGLDGKGNVSLVDAQSFLSRAAEAGRTDAAALLGGAYLGGRFGARDPKSAEPWLSKAAADDADSAYVLAIIEIDGDGIPPNSASGIRHLKLAADMGHAAAMADYGLLVYQGKASATPSKADAAVWFEKSAKAGDPEGQFLYAYSLATGQGLARDPIQAYIWVLRSSSHSASAPEYDSDRGKLKAGLEKLLRPDEIAKAAIEAQKPAA
jgi:uncharacterized protein